MMSASVGLASHAFTDRSGSERIVPPRAAPARPECGHMLRAWLCRPCPGSASRGRVSPLCASRHVAAAAGGADGCSGRVLAKLASHRVQAPRAEHPRDINTPGDLRELDRQARLIRQVSRELSQRLSQHRHRGALGLRDVVEWTGGRQVAARPETREQSDRHEVHLLRTLTDAPRSSARPRPCGARAAIELQRRLMAGTFVHIELAPVTRVTAKLARAGVIESRVDFKAGPAANNLGPRAVLRRLALRAARQRTLEANGIDCGAGPVTAVRPPPTAFYQR